jgi:uncharacterized protein (TIGR03067 family)
MKCFICVISFLGWFLVSDTTQDDATAKDQASIQGVWRLVSLEVPEHEVPPREQPRNATMTIKENTMLNNSDGNKTEYEFKLNASETPKTIDLSRPGENKKGPRSVLLGVYSLEGDEFKMCAGKPRNERPKELKKTETNAVLVFKREKPNP